MMMSNKAATRYSRRVKRHLVCGAASREQIHTRASALIENFAEENPDAQYADYTAAFGEPKIFAAEILSVLDEKEVETAIRYTKYRLVVAISVCALMVLLIVGYLFTHYLNAQKIVHGDFRVTEEVEQTLTPDEIQKQFPNSGG